MEHFKVVPRFTLQKSLTEETLKTYNSVLNEGIKYYNNLTKKQFAEWQSDVAEVREQMKSWHHLDMFQSMCGQDTGKVAILQMADKGDISNRKWLGAEVADERELCDVDSLVIYNSEALNTLSGAAYHSGLIIDNWIEYIPYTQQTAGMVFHCDRPDNEAPQSILMALSSDFLVNGNNTNWDTGKILKILDSTMKMVKCRAIDVDDIYKDSDLSTVSPFLIYEAPTEPQAPQES